MSRDINTLVSLIVSFYAFSFFVKSAIGKIQINFQHQLTRAGFLETLHPEDVMELFLEIALLFVTTALPAMLLIGFASFAAAMSQTKLLISYENIKFKMERIDPIKGFKKLFSLRSLVELLKSIIKITVLTWILYINIKDSMTFLPSIIDWDIQQALNFTGREIMALVVSVAVSFGSVAVLDFLYQRWEYEKGIRMTKQEVKDEYKQMEGNPEVKSKRRQKQQEFAQNRMMQQVKDADVVVRNPTHYAVAIKYRIDHDPAPIVLAKGVDRVALRIVEEAEKHQVITVENKPLARGLYHSADILGYIPAEFFQPVAELLAWIYTVKEKEKGKVQQ